jgi:transcriptional regulator GlxA family with amidase domain
LRFDRDRQRRAPVRRSSLFDGIPSPFVNQPEHRAASAKKSCWTDILATTPDRRPQKFGVVLLPDFSLVGFSLAIEPLRAANAASDRDLYRWTLLSVDGAAVTASNGIAVKPEQSLAKSEEFDAVIVIGGAGSERVNDGRILGFLRRTARMGTPLGAISTAPYVLARAGLLNGRRCTIHWDYLDSLSQEYPDLETTNELFVMDGPVATCCGEAAAIDLMLYLIGAQYGHELAAEVSEQFIYKKIRDAREHQRMNLRSRLGTSNPRLLAAVHKMEENLETPLEREDVAEAVHVSTRQLERLFRKHLNSTPRKYYFRLRIQRARTLLRQTSMSVLDVAVACGFNSASHFSACYRDFFGHSPRQERASRIDMVRPA